MAQTTLLSIFTAWSVLAAQALPQAAAAFLAVWIWQKIDSRKNRGKAKTSEMFWIFITIWFFTAAIMPVFMFTIPNFQGAGPRSPAEVVADGTGIPLLLGLILGRLLTRWCAKKHAE